MRSQYSPPLPALPFAPCTLEVELQQDMTTAEPITVIDDSSPGPFEGPEKLLELWFAPSEQDVTDRQLELKGGRTNAEGRKSPRWTGLRQVERSVWDSMLDEVQCKALSVIEGEECDAYLLR